MFRKVIRALARFIFKLFYRVEIHGLEKVDLQEKYVVCVNHRYANDIFFVSAAYKPEVAILGKKEIFRNKLFTWFATSMGALPVDRGNSDFAVLKKSLKALKKSSLVIFPEGTRNSELKPLGAKAGVGLLCVKSRKPILPMAIVNKNNRLFSKVKIFFLEPIKPTEFKYEKYDSEVYIEIGNSILNKIYDVINEEFK